MCTRSSILRRNVSWHTEHVKTWQCEGQAGSASAGRVPLPGLPLTAGKSLPKGVGALGWERVTQNLLALTVTIAECCKATTPGWESDQGQRPTGLTCDPHSDW